MAGLWTRMKTWSILHFLFCYILLVSGFITCFLMSLTLVLWPLNKDLYRKVNSYLAYLWWCQFTFLGQWWSGTECVLYIEPSDLQYIGKEHALVIMNHKYDIDWLMGWILTERFGMLGGSKIYGKKFLKYIPILGWIWYFTESIFLERNWDQDQKTLVRDIQEIASFPQDVCITILLFCEGTRFTEEKHRISMEVAEKKGFPYLKHHLLPRTKGFVLSLQAMKGKIPAIYDCTVAFRKDGAEPTLRNILHGRMCRAEMYVRRIPIDTVPYNDSKECANWLHKLYQEKDKLFDQFTMLGRFSGVQKRTIPRRYWDLIVWLCWASVLCLPLFVYIWNLIQNGITLYQALFVVTLTVVARFFMKWSIGLSVIKKGSAYGKKN
ncbi:1-acyl-sn-glycerol-3-phosphate acyltransferase delta isoform X1 [Octopus vulgaris]|uniref:1-acyl-sn-glycerol-3-phosphate acyltransferase delta isoform X1 n=2 Tax=Octopus TaxID=6643 RepID=A0AA36ALJ1_OCTVU|nr:1-acyl-sn-glycerol-3-phosphate acyltransferase delta isoform X1 [Octopus sinensis]XP_036370381.1 1-acyl-sn-glycerol-3-phosphate acyltransferase delta isoform X1 [Octopus sinensis]CAI9718224.1 1-acyl-sn-glycerol-3-phosphate acyltransferase delta isoform X1 [Octopus vulgaris]